jgi:hypothetical protein
VRQSRGSSQECEVSLVDGLVDLGKGLGITVAAHEIPVGLGRWAGEALPVPARLGLLTSAPAAAAANESAGVEEGARQLQDRMTGHTTRTFLVQVSSLRQQQEHTEIGPSHDSILITPRAAATSPAPSTIASVVNRRQRSLGETG